MKKSIPPSFALMLLVVLAIGCTNPADKAPDAAVGDAKPAPAQYTGGEAYKISPDSTVSFVGSKVTGSHDGGFHEFTGTIMLVDNDPTRSSVSLTIDNASIWADDDRLTGHLKSPDFFEVETYPTSTFNSTAIAAEGDGYMVTGNFDLHGVTKSITFPATIAVAEDKITAQAEFSIKRFDFGIVYKGMADNLIRDEVKITFDLIAMPHGT